MILMVEEAWKPEMVFWMQFDLWQLLWESVSLMCSISLETLMHSFFFYCNKLQSLDILHFSSSVLPGIDHVQIVQCYAFSKPGSSQASIFCKAVQHHSDASRFLTASAVKIFFLHSTNKARDKTQFALFTILRDRNVF